MGDLALPVVYIDGGDRVELGTLAVPPALGVKRLQAMVADHVGVAPHQISASLARPRRARRVPLDDGTDLAAAVAREGVGCYVLATPRRSRRDRRGGRSRREKKSAAAAAAPAPMPEKTILKRLPPTDLASLAAAAAPSPAPLMFGAWDYEAQLRELQRQRDWYLMSTAAADPYFPLAPPEPEDPPLWSPRGPPRLGTPSPCPECEAAAAARRAPAFHRCVRDAVVSAGFRSHVGPIERPPKKSPSPPPPPPSPARFPAFIGMPVY
ncbi:hypothetical protein ACP4OV_025990 [Aristida adscensionis]